jgi:hypothetical protein
MRSDKPMHISDVLRAMEDDEKQPLQFLLRVVRLEAEMKRAQQDLEEQKRAA